MLILYSIAQELPTGAFSLRSRHVLATFDWYNGFNLIQVYLLDYSVGAAVAGGQQRYLAYMLRLWEASSDEELDWRASLESPHTGERHGFANLETLFAFLEKKTGDQLERKEQSPE